MCEFCLLSDELKRNINDLIHSNFEKEWERNFNLAKYIQRFAYHFDENVEVQMSADENDSDEEEIANNKNLNFQNASTIIGASTVELALLDKQQTTNDTTITHENLAINLELLRQLEYHIYIAQRQKNAYNQMTSNISYYDNSILIDYDFKQKLVFGLSPRAKSYEYYFQKQASLLGFGIYYIDPKLPLEVSCLRVNIISDCLDQDAEAVLRGFKFLRSQQFFKDIEKTKINIFSDTGNFFISRYIKYLHY